MNKEIEQYIENAKQGRDKLNAEIMNLIRQYEDEYTFIKVTDIDIKRVTLLPYRVDTIDKIECEIKVLI